MAPNGAIFTVAGNGRFGYWGDGGAATSAALYFPAGVALDQAGNVYVADSQNNVVRMLAPVSDSFAAPAIGAGGISVQAAFGGGNVIAPGSFIEIVGSSLAGRSGAWANADFRNSVAPTMLEGTTVKIGGQAAFLSAVAPDRILAIVPAGVDPGTRQLDVATVSGTSDPSDVEVAASLPSLLAPPEFNIGGKQYVSALLSDGATYALPAGAVADKQSRPVRPGETVTIYGMGFGPLVPDVPIGTKNNDPVPLAGAVQVLFGGVPATVSFAGLAANQVGLYEFDVVVPDDAGFGPVPVTFQLGDATGRQELYVEIESAQP